MGIEVASSCFILALVFGREAFCTGRTLEASKFSGCSDWDSPDVLRGPMEYCSTVLARAHGATRGNPSHGSMILHDLACVRYCIECYSAECSATEARVCSCASLLDLRRC